MRIYGLLLMLFLYSGLRSQDLEGAWIEEGNTSRGFGINIIFSSDSTFEGETMTIFKLYDHTFDTVECSMRGTYNRKNGKIWLTETGVTRGDKKYEICNEVLKLKVIRNKKRVLLKGFSWSDGPNCPPEAKTAWTKMQIVLKKFGT